jgi:hypothetical protein
MTWLKTGTKKEKILKKFLLPLVYNWKLLTFMFPTVQSLKTYVTGMSLLSVGDNYMKIVDEKGDQKGS